VDFWPVRGDRIMATVTALLKSAHGADARGRQPYMVQNTINMANTGVTNASADIIQAITIPADTVVLNAGMEIMTAMSGDSGSDTTFDLGVTGTEPDIFADGFDADSGTAAGTYSVNAADFRPLITESADTIDVLIKTATTAPTAGKVRVWAIMMDVSDVGVMTADEVDRDTLA